ncbi:MAG: hypothetical protein HRT74_04100 [Flavobacteriales bacterium]|nr:hypothetical protein [Flavobacteriales bacterium]
MKISLTGILILLAITSVQGQMFMEQLEFKVEHAQTRLSEQNSAGRKDYLIAVNRISLQNNGLATSFIGSYTTVGFSYPVYKGLRIGAFSGHVSLNSINHYRYDNIDGQLRIGTVTRRHDDWVLGAYLEQRIPLFNGKRQETYFIVNVNYAKAIGSGYLYSVQEVKTLLNEEGSIERQEYFELKTENRRTDHILRLGFGPQIMIYSVKIGDFGIGFKYHYWLNDFLGAGWETYLVSADDLSLSLHYCLGSRKEKNVERKE